MLCWNSTLTVFPSSLLRHLSEQQWDPGIAVLQDWFEITGVHSQSTTTRKMYRRFCYWEHYLLSVSTILLYPLKYDFTELSSSRLLSYLVCACTMPYNYIFQKPQLTIISSFSISFSEASKFLYVGYVWHRYNETKCINCIQSLEIFLLEK